MRNIDKIKQLGKSKWKPLYIYQPVCDNTRKMIFVRLDYKTGLMDFCTKHICDGMYSEEPFTLRIKPQKVFEELLQEVTND